VFTDYGNAPDNLLFTDKKTNTTKNIKKEKIDIN